MTNPSLFFWPYLPLDVYIAKDHSTYEKLNSRRTQIAYKALLRFKLYKKMSERCCIATSMKWIYIFFTERVVYEGKCSVEASIVRHLNWVST